MPLGRRFGNGKAQLVPSGDREKNSNLKQAVSFVVSYKETKIEMHLGEADLVDVWDTFVLLIKRRADMDIICKEEYMASFFLRGEAV